MKKIADSKWTGIALAAAGILMMVYVIYRGEMAVVLMKAVNTCMECIELDKKTNAESKYKDKYKGLARHIVQALWAALTNSSCVWF